MTNWAAAARNRARANTRTPESLAPDGDRRRQCPPLRSKSLRAVGVAARGGRGRHSGYHISLSPAQRRTRTPGLGAARRRPTHVEVQLATIRY